MWDSDYLSIDCDEVLGKDCLSQTEGLPSAGISRQKVHLPRGRAEKKTLEMVRLLLLRERRYVPMYVGLQIQKRGDSYPWLTASVPCFRP